jgi:hypothetical protein
MEEEYEALLSNRTWDLVPRPPGANVITEKWIFNHKFKAVVRTVLTLALSRCWLVHQLDIKNAFLHDTLSEMIYCSKSNSFVDPAHPELVFRLNKSLYVLK